MLTGAVAWTAEEKPPQKPSEPKSSRDEIIVGVLETPTGEWQIFSSDIADISGTRDSSGPPPTNDERTSMKLAFGDVFLELSSPRKGN